MLLAVVPAHRMDHLEAHPPVEWCSIVLAVDLPSRALAMKQRDLDMDSYCLSKVRFPMSEKIFAAINEIFPEQPPVF